MICFRVKGDEPLLVVFDSMGGSNTRPLSIIREWLRQEWNAKEGHRFSPRDFS